MGMCKNGLMAGAVGIFAIAVAIPAAQADTVYGLTIYQADCGGSSASCAAGSSTFTSAAAGFESGLVALGPSVTSGWTSTLAGGGLNFLYPGTASNSGTIAGFLATGTGTPNLTYVGTNTSGNTLSVAGFGLSTEFVFTGTLSVASNITVTHDDGFTFSGAGGVNITGQANPTDATCPGTGCETFLANAGAFTLNYVSANGLPEQLDFTATPVVPLPGTVWLFGAGLGGLGLLMRRRRNNGLARAV